MEHIDWGAVLDAVAKIATALGVLYAAWKGRENGKTATLTHEIVNSQRTAMVNLIAKHEETIQTLQGVISDARKVPE